MPGIYRKNIRFFLTKQSLLQILFESDWLAILDSQKSLFVYNTAVNNV